MRTLITHEIEEFVRTYEKKDDISTKWGKPLVGFADAGHPLILNLPGVISASHQLPCDVLSDASIIIVYFVPFTRELARTNRSEIEIASREWAIAYEETNAMFVGLNEYLIGFLEEKGYRAAVSPETRTFDRKKLISNWSHRHIAGAAGLGTFGLNNMLITKSGCCGRYHSLVTNLNVEPDLPEEEEYCLYKKNGSCGVCIRHCPAGALSLEGYDREKCYEVLQKNAKIHVGLGSSYGGDTSDFDSLAIQTESGSDVCGKCIAFAPCAFFNDK